MFETGFKMRNREYVRSNSPEGSRASRSSQAIIERKVLWLFIPPRLSCFLCNLFQPLRAQLLGAGVTALFTTKFAQGDGSGVLFAG
jgi:hypothetical protein